MPNPQSHGSKLSKDSKFESKLKSLTNSSSSEDSSNTFGAAQEFLDRFNLSEMLEPVKGYARSAANFMKSKPGIIIGSAAAAVGLGALAYSLKKSSRSSSSKKDVSTLSH